MADNIPMPNYGHMLQWIVFCLLGVAVVMVYSAGMTIGSEPLTVEKILLGRPVIYALLAVLVMFIVSFVDLRRVFEQRGVTNPVAWVLLASIVLCVVVLVPGIGREVNGAYRWLNIGPRSWNLSFQPSELAKWAMVLAIAWWGARRAGAMRNLWHGLLPALVVLGLVCGLIVTQDLGTAVLIGLVAFLVLLAAGARWWQLGMWVVPAGAVLAYEVINEPYRMRRITSFLTPWEDAGGAGYHLIHSLKTIQEGGLAGRGLGNSVMKFGYLPEDTTDFIFAVICAELGVAGACLVVSLYGGLMICGLAVIREHRHAFGRLLGLGVLLTVGLQALMNLAVVTGLVPTKGIALPLLSNGGTGWIMTAGAIGMLVGLDRINRMEAAGDVAACEEPPELNPQPPLPEEPSLAGAPV